MCGQDVLCGISKVPLKFHTKYICPYIERYDIIERSKFQKLWELIIIFEMAPRTVHISHLCLFESHLCFLEWTRSFGGLYMEISVSSGWGRGGGSWKWIDLPICVIQHLINDLLKLNIKSYHNKLGFTCYVMCIVIQCVCSRDHFVYAPSQWKMTFRCNVISHWLGAYTKWLLCISVHNNSLWPGVGIWNHRTLSS